MSVTAEMESGRSPFSKRVVFWGVLASLLAAAGFFLLATYAPDFRMGRLGGGTPLSKGGSGYAGIVRLLELNGHEADFNHSLSGLSDDYSLLVVTIAPQADSEVLADLVEARDGLPTLFVLPKWRTAPMPGRDGWEVRAGQLDPSEVQRWLSIIGEYKIDALKNTATQLTFGDRQVAAPESVQTIVAGEGLVMAGPARAVVVEIPDRGFTVLADPDLINNKGLKDGAMAAFGADLILQLSSDTDGILFDLAIYGEGRKHDMFKLLVEPPFLALTLSVLAAAALAFLHGLGRFGPPLPDRRAIPFGKQALVDTTAALVRRAGRLNEMGGDYAALMRGRAGALLGAPPGLPPEALDNWLDALNRDDEEPYSNLVRALRSARSEADVATAAKRLHQWIARRIGERN